MPYDIMPYLMREYRNDKRDKPDLDDFSKTATWVKHKMQYMYWSRTQYEIILVNWPNQTISEKWDIYKQFLMNYPIVTRIFIENIKQNKRIKNE